MKNRHATATPEELITELRGLVCEAEAMLGDSLKEHSADALEALRIRFAAAQDRVANAYATARRKVVAGACGADDIIRGNPYQSSAVAGVDVLAGGLLGRNRK